MSWKLGLSPRTPRTAAQWVVRLNAGQLSARDRAALDVWLSARPGRRAEFDHAKAIWALAPRLAESPAMRAELAVGRSRPPRALWPALPIGAALAVGLLLVATNLFGGRVYETPVGGRQTAQLADGSTIWLNTDTRIRVRLGARQRQVALERGEAFFKVAHDQARPFVVAVDGRRVVVTGTQFDVRRQGEGVEVAVVEGHVRIERAATASATEARLSAGDDAHFASRLAAPKIVRAAAVARRSAWRRGEIDLDDVSLAEAVEEINRYSATKIVIDRPDLAGLSLSGVFRTGDIDGFLFAVRQIYGIQDHRQGQQILLDRPQG
ncbi:MAG: FecR domain-containing protein [Caulobacteraceae bacterium]|nr:FecR domain-containing protein [Caulobacteraceae bacterium]